MLKRPIKYEDFNGDEITEVFYFNLTRSELIEMDVAYEGGLSNVFQRIVEAKKEEELIREFKKFILAAYGEKSDDGKRFKKKDDNDRPLSRNFEQTAAYDALFMDLATNAESASTFLIGVVPKDFQSEMSKAMATAQLPSPPSLFSDQPIANPLTSLD